MAGKERLDLLLVQQGLLKSRERAKARIMAGQVLVNNNKVDKPGTMVESGACLRLLGDDLPYVSRGGLKLEGAIKRFNLNLKGKTLLDVGASTGGFTDCALKHGAVKVFAVDVGYGQLAWELRQDARVINLERTNARFLTGEDLGEAVDMATIDVAFISLQKILPTIFSMVKQGGEIIALIKPQFEAGKEKVGKKGVVRDPIVHQRVIEEIIGFAETFGWYTGGLAPSPIKGPQGNIEFLLRLSREVPAFLFSRVLEVVEEAWHSME